MRQKMRLALVVFLGSLACWLNAAQAQTTYSYFYIGGQATYTGLTPGSTINVPLYLQEVNGDGSTNSLLASEGGLFAAGVSVAFSSSSGGVVTTITGVNPNSGSPTTGFDDVLDQSNTSISAAILEPTELQPWYRAMVSPMFFWARSCFKRVLVQVRRQRLPSGRMTLAMATRSPSTVAMILTTTWTR